MNKFSAEETITQISAHNRDAREILTFWFIETTPKQHFMKDLAFDRLIKDRFHAKMQEIYTQGDTLWRETAGGALAACIVVDQFSRNVFRDTPDAFAHDVQGLAIAKCIREQHFYPLYPKPWRIFAILPFMHSENLADQQECLRLTAEWVDAADEGGFAMAHFRIIEQFGRFPHRNTILGRKSTKAEEEFLKQPGSSF